MAVFSALVRSPFSSLAGSVLGGDGGSVPSISLSAPDFGGSTYYEGVDDNDVTVTINNATDGASWDLTISSSGGGTPVTASGTVSGSTVSAGAQDLTGLNAGALTFSYEEASVEVATKVRTLATTAAPGAPVITATPSTSGAAQNVITWPKPAENGSAITGYTLTVDDGSGFSALATPAAGDTSYTHTGLVIDKEYTYRLTATNGVGTSSNSNEPAATPTGTVHVFLLAGQSNMLGRATFDDNGDYATGRVFDWTGSDFRQATSPLTNADAGDMGLTITFTDDYLAANPGVDAVALVQMAVGGTSITTWNDGDTNHENAVTEVNQALAAYSNYSLEGGLWHQGEADDALTEASYASQLDAIISAWRSSLTGASASTPFVVGQIFADEGAGPRAALADTPNRVAYTGFADIDSLTQFDGVHFDAASLRTLGERYYTAFANALTNAPGLAGAPTNLSATSGNLQAVLTWDAPANTGLQDITDYTVQYRAVGSGTWLTFSDGVSASTGATVTGLSASTDYEFQVAAVNASGTGPFSSTDNVVVGPLAPSQVGTVTPTPSDGQVALSWSAPANNGASITDYIVQYKLSSSSTWITFSDGTSATTSATVTGLTNDSAYDFQVAAVNSVGTGDYSATVSSTPTATVDLRTAALTAVNATSGSLWDMTDISTLYVTQDGSTTPVSSSGDTIAFVEDRATRGDDMVQGTSASRPEWNGTEMHFASDDDRIAADGDFSGFTNATIFLAFKSDVGSETSTGSRRILLSDAALGFLGACEGGSTSTGVDDTDVGSYHVDGGSALSSPTRGDLYDSYCTGSWVIVEMRGVDLTTRDGASTYASLGIGSYTSSSFGYNAGDAVAACSILQAPSTAQQNAVREWMADLVGVTLP